MFIVLLGSIAYLLKINLQINPISILGSIALGIQRLLPAASKTFQAYTGIKARYDTALNIVEIIKNTPQDFILEKKLKNQFYFKS